MFQISLGDRLPAITATITNAGDLSGATVQLRWKLPDGTTKEGTGSVVDGPEGRVSYAWAVGDLPVVGSYTGTWVITMGGLPMTVPAAGFKFKVVAVAVPDPTP